MKKQILLSLGIILGIIFVSAGIFDNLFGNDLPAKVENDKIVYDFDYGRTNFTLIKQISEKNIQIITDISVSKKDGKIKFQGEDSSLSLDNTAYFYYEIKSDYPLGVHAKTLRVAGERELDPMSMPPFPDDPIWDEIGYIYSWPIVYQIQKNGWDDKKQKYNFQDVCKNKDSKCKWELSKDLKNFKIYFISGKIIDPEITNVSGCGELSIDGQFYEMNHSITNDFIGLPEQSWFGSNCITITAPNIILDCKGYKINETDNSGVWDHAGIYSNQLNTTIRNCDVTTHKVGDRTLGSSLTTSQSPSGWGIVLNGANNSHIYNNVVDDQDFGIALMSTSHSTIENNTMLRNLFMGLGLMNWITLTEGSINNTIRDNNISEYDEYYPTEKNQYQAVNIYLGYANVFLDNEISRGDFRVHLAQIIIGGLLRFTDSDQLFEVEGSGAEVNITLGGEIRGS